MTQYIYVSKHSPRGVFKDCKSVNWRNNCLDSHLLVAVEQPLYGFEGTFFQQSTLSPLTSLPSAVIFSPFILSHFSTQEHFVSLFLCLPHSSPRCLNPLICTGNAAVALISAITGRLSNSAQRHFPRDETREQRGPKYCLLL